MRFCGTVGYANVEETAPGVWTEVITEKQYYGSVIRNARRLESPSLEPPELNANISLENSFSILADAEAYENFTKMRYISWEGSNWTITKVEVQRPRLILQVGGLWNGNTA
jgi:hypothetical protein